MNVVGRLGGGGGGAGRRVSAQKHRLCVLVKTA